MAMFVGLAVCPMFGSVFGCEGYVSNFTGELEFSANSVQVRLIPEVLGSTVPIITSFGTSFSSSSSFLWVGIVVFARG